MSRLTYDEVQGNEFATTYNWELIIPFAALPTALQAALQEAGVIGGTVNTGSIQGILNQHCLSTGLPSSDVVNAEATIRGHKIYQPTTRNYNGNITLSFPDRADGRLGTMMEVWKNLTHASKDGSGKPKSQLMASKNGSIMVNQLTSDGLSTFRKHKLFWVYPESVTLTELGGDGGQFQDVSLTLKYGRYEQVLSN